MKTVERYTLPRNSLLWLLSAQSLALAPLFYYLPTWLLVVWSSVLLWRLQLFRGQWQMPGWFTKSTLVTVCCAGLLSSFGRFLGMEPMVALLICALLLKQLEMQRHRDALLLVYLTFFLVAVQFLFNQSLVIALYGGICFWVNTVALLAIHQPKGHEYPRRSMRLAGRMLLHSIPLMVLLFLVMPRLGNLWAVPNPSHGATTGVSDSMSPGDFSKLTRSGGVAFRVSFEGSRPSQEQLYWRGLVFSSFDGRRWEQADPYHYRYDGSPVNWRNEPRLPWRPLAQALAGDRYHYQVTMEPSFQPWLYSLSLPTSYSIASGFNLGFTRDFRLIADKSIHQRTQYLVTSSVNYALEPDPLPDWRRRLELFLPEGYNPRALAMATQWRQQAGSDWQYVNRVLEFYRSRFTYTLEPPALGQHTVDDFLFATQQGFCEHFASSFVVMMRAAGIPARVVAGYMGGEFNEAENYLVVHQYDAHAWTEIWLQGRGWVRVDPTAAVAPERVRQSLGQSSADQVQGLLSLGRYRHIKILNQLRLEWDALNYRWHQAVIGFDAQSQSRFLSRWFGRIDPLKMVFYRIGRWCFNSGFDEPAFVVAGPTSDCFVGSGVLSTGRAHIAATRLVPQ